MLSCPSRQTSLVRKAELPASATASVAYALPVLSLTPPSRQGIFGILLESPNCQPIPLSLAAACSSRATQGCEPRKRVLRPGCKTHLVSADVRLDAQTTSARLLRVVTIRHTVPRICWPMRPSCNRSETPSQASPDRLTATEAASS